MGVQSTQPGKWRITRRRSKRNIYTFNGHLMWNRNNNSINDKNAETRVYTHILALGKYHFLFDLMPTTPPPSRRRRCLPSPHQLPSGKFMSTHGKIETQEKGWTVCGEKGMNEQRPAIYLRLFERKETGLRAFFILFLACWLLWIAVLTPTRSQLYMIRPFLFVCSLSFFCEQTMKYILFSISSFHLQSAKYDSIIGGSL